MIKIELPLEYTKTLNKFRSDDETREPINNIYVDGEMNIYSTDGKRLVKINGKAYGVEIKPGIYKLLSVVKGSKHHAVCILIKDESGLEYPNVNAVLYNDGVDTELSVKMRKDKDKDKDNVNVFVVLYKLFNIKKVAINPELLLDLPKEVEFKIYTNNSDDVSAFPLLLKGNNIEALIMPLKIK